MRIDREMHTHAFKETGNQIKLNHQTTNLYQNFNYINVNKDNINVQTSLKYAFT